MERLIPELITGPAVALITRDEAKGQIRRDDDDDDQVIDALIAVVMSRLDGVGGILGRALVEQTWSESMCGFPTGDRLALALAPVRAVDSVTYYDTDNAEQTFPAGSYTKHNKASGGYVRLNSTAAWPGTYDRDDAVTVTYKAGYGANASDVPAVIKHAAMLLLSHWYENREAVLLSGAPNLLPEGVMALLRPHIRPHF